MGVSLLRRVLGEGLVPSGVVRFGRGDTSGSTRDSSPMQYRTCVNREAARLSIKLATLKSCLANSNSCPGLPRTRGPR